MISYAQRLVEKYFGRSSEQPVPTGRLLKPGIDDSHKLESHEPWQAPEKDIGKTRQQQMDDEYCRALEEMVE